MLQLTTEQIQSFDDHGYLRLDALADPQEVPKIRATIEKLFKERAGENEGAYGELITTVGEENEANSPQLLNPVNYAPQLHNTKCFQNAANVAKQLLGDEVRFFLDNTILKTAKTGVATPWHQDAAFRDPGFEYRELAIWVPLQDVDETSGCLQFIPGSHKDHILEHRYANDDPSSLALECSDSIDRSSAVPCPLPAGGCTIHHPGTLHCSSPNVSDLPRFAYIMVFGVSPKLAKEHRVYKWREQRETPLQVRRRRWMLRGGFVVTAWRRLRRGDLMNWQSLVYWTKRSIHVLRSGS